jgi:two-component system, OmpR family, sensor histidine kinase TctE
MRIWLRSLEGSLAVRLGLLYLLAMAFAVGALLYQAYDTAGSLNDRDLNLRATDLARYVVLGPDHTPQLELPPKLATAYETGSSDLYAVRSQDGRVIAASPRSFGVVVSDWPAPSDEASYFRLKAFGPDVQDYHGASVSVPSVAGPLSVFVGRIAEGSLLAHALLREFMVDAAWLIPLFMVITLATGKYAISAGLKPVRQISEMAAAIGPGNTAVRLPEHDLPGELVPLVGAVNRALDRLAQGFAVQREFTANAAHELRTPLTIITAALDTMPGDGGLTKLKSDVARMNRIVEQLLRVARLDAVGLDVSGKVDLNVVAEGVVAAMAPLALAQDRMIAFLPADPPVHVRGNAGAIEDAIRNLVENAVAHTSSHSEVTVDVAPDGSVTVADEGPGIAPEHRQHVFQRFWRGKGAPNGGAGLGLAIVKEVADAHHATIHVDDSLAGRGARFTMRFSPWLDAHHTAELAEPVGT